MAKKKTPAEPGNGVEFDVPDDVFGPDGDVDGDDAPPTQEAKEDEPAEEADEPKKDKPPKVQAKQEDEEQDEPDLPPVDPPADPAFLLAEERARRAELEARMAAYEASQKQAAKDPEADEDKALQDRKKAARDKAMRATREGDEATRQEAMWELGDLEREEYRRDSARQLRELRAARDGQGSQPQQAGLTPQQRMQIEAETFRAAHRVTSEEERKMEVEWAKFTAKNPAWNNARPWTKFDKALKLVRKTGGSEASSTALVDGGQHAAASKGKYANKSKLELGARLFGVDVETYKKVVSKHGRKGA